MNNYVKPVIHVTESTAEGVFAAQASHGENDNGKKCTRGRKYYNADCRPCSDCKIAYNVSGRCPEGMPKQGNNTGKDDGTNKFD